jgi:energy-coupling factor transport system substrate-specific component
MSHSFSAWRTVDLIVAAVLAVASGVIFVAWNATYAPLSLTLAGFTPGFVGILGGVWLIGGLLVALVVRRPGAAVLGEVIAASVSAIIGNQWGFTVLILGVAQGMAMELGFRLMRGSKVDFFIVATAGAFGGAIQGVLEYLYWYPGTGPEFAAVFIASATASGAILGAGLSVLLVRALSKTGILATFGR